MTKIFEAQFEYCLMPDPSVSSPTAITHYDYSNAFVPMQGFGVIRGVTNNNIITNIPGFPSIAPNGYGYNMLIVNNANVGMAFNATNIVWPSGAGIAPTVTCGPYGTISIPAEWWQVLSDVSPTFEIAQVTSAGIGNPISGNYATTPYTVPLNFDIFFWQ